MFELPYISDSVFSIINILQLYGTFVTLLTHYYGSILMLLTKPIVCSDLIFASFCSRLPSSIVLHPVTVCPQAPFGCEFLRFSLFLMTSADFKQCQSGILQNVFSDWSDILPLIKLRLYALGERKTTAKMSLLTLQTMGTCSQDDLTWLRQCLSGVLHCGLLSPSTLYVQLTLKEQRVMCPFLRAEYLCGTLLYEKFLV